MLLAWRRCWPGPPRQPSATLAPLAAALCGALQRHGHTGPLRSRFVAFGPAVVWVSLPACTEGDGHSETRWLRAASQGWLRVRPRCFTPQIRTCPQQPRGAPAGIGANGEWGLHQSHLPCATLGLVRPDLAPWWAPWGLGCVGLCCASGPCLTSQLWPCSSAPFLLNLVLL